MGNRLSISKKGSALSKQELIEMGKAAREEQDRLLKERPSLKEFQKEIDRCLNNAGSSENRMAVLGIMMGAKLKELQEQLSHFSFLIRQMEAHTHYPIEQNKF